MKFFWMLVGFIAGTAAGWVAAVKFTADWVSAAGTWVGALATIATIIWAVRSFQLESQDRHEDRERNADQRLRDELTHAAEFSVRIRDGGGFGPDGNKTMTSINVEILNGTPGAVTLEELELPGVVLKDASASLALPLIVLGHAEPVPYRQVEIEPISAPDNEFSGRPFTLSTPTIRYRIGGVAWKRTGEDAPVRVAG